MPLNKTTFDDEWIKDPRFPWIAKTANDNEAMCTLCKKSSSVANGGIYQVQQHACGVKHKSLVSSLSTQPRFQFADGESSRRFKPTTKNSGT
jgi:hypothetical protein